MSLHDSDVLTVNGSDEMRVVERLKDTINDPVHLGGKVEYLGGGVPLN